MEPSGKNDFHPGKIKSLTFSFRSGFGSMDGLNYVAKKATVKSPLAAIRGWSFHQRFGNPGEYWAFFLKGRKRTVLRAFPDPEKPNRSPYRAYLSDSFRPQEFTLRDPKANLYLSLLQKCMKWDQNNTYWRRVQRLYRYQKEPSLKLSGKGIDILKNCPTGSFC